MGALLADHLHQSGHHGTLSSRDPESENVRHALAVNSTLEVAARTPVAERLRTLLPVTRVVKASSICGYENVKNSFCPGYNVRPVMLSCGKDAGAQQTVDRLTLLWVRMVRHSPQWAGQGCSGEGEADRRRRMGEPVRLQPFESLVLSLRSSGQSDQVNRLEQKALLPRIGGWFAGRPSAGR